VLFAGDTSGEVLAWQILGVHMYSKCLVRLCANTSSENKSENTIYQKRKPAIASLCATDDTAHSLAFLIASDENGNIMCWKVLDILISAVKIQISRRHFEPLPEALYIYRTNGFNPSLRITRKASVFHVVAQPHSTTRACSASIDLGTLEHSKTHLEVGILSWIVNDQNFLQVRHLQNHGFIFTYSEENNGVKLWDSQGGCLGILQSKEYTPESNRIEWKYRVNMTVESSQDTLNSAFLKRLVNETLDNVIQRDARLSPSTSTDVIMKENEKKVEDITGYLQSDSPKALNRHKSVAQMSEKTYNSIQSDEEELSPAMSTILKAAIRDQAFSSKLLLF